MVKVIVDAMGDTCPIPIVKTKDAIAKMTEPGTVEVLVDNEISVQNLLKMAKVKGYEAKGEKLDDAKYSVSLEVRDLTNESENMQDNYSENEDSCIPDLRASKMVVVIHSNQMGQGSEELGKTLLKGFLFALTKQDRLPSTILFYNSGIDLTCEGSPALEDLKLLEASGVEILSCGTCLNYYEKSEKLAVGSVTNMYEIVRIMEEATSIVKPC